MTTKQIPAPLVTESAEELLARDLPPVLMVVGDVLPAGLILLAGDPKAGKSLLAQDLSLSVSQGTPAWGGLDVEQGDVLYLANEGGQRSFRSRLETMLNGDSAPTNLHISYKSEPLGARLEAQLDDWMVNHPTTRLIVIDTYSSVAPETRGVNRHQEDYNALAGLADFTNRNSEVLLLVIHHTRKAEGEDVIHRISGSQGMTAATDGNAVLSRHTAARQCILTVRPRNAEESELVLERGEDLRWSVVGNDERARLSGGRQQILELMETETEMEFSPKNVAARLGMSSENARKYMSQMAKNRQIVRGEHGVYQLTSNPF